LAKFLVDDEAACYFQSFFLASAGQLGRWGYLSEWLHFSAK
jgi:hypothetical protein